MRAAELELGWEDLQFSPLAAMVTTSVAGRGLGGDFEFESLKGELALRRFLWFGDEAVLRLSAGAIRGEAPYQSLHHLGGLTRLRGYEVNEFPARRFSLLRLGAFPDINSNPSAVPILPPAISSSSSSARPPSSAPAS